MNREDMWDIIQNEIELIAERDAEGDILDFVDFIRECVDESRQIRDKFRSPYIDDVERKYIGIDYIGSLLRIASAAIYAIENFYAEHPECNPFHHGSSET